MILHLKKGAIVQLYLFPAAKDAEPIQFVGKIVDVTDYEVVICPQRYIANDYIEDKKQPIHVYDIYELQTMDTFEKIHIDKNAIFAWKYFEVPTKSDNLYHDYVIRKDIKAGKYASDMINVYNYKTYICEGYGEYFE